MKSLTMNVVKIDRDVEKVLHQFFALVKVTDAELGVGCAAVVVLYYRIADIYRVAGLDVVEEICHIECDGRDMMIWM